MIEFITIHVIYLGAAIFLFRHVLGRTNAMPESTRRMTRTFAGATLFAPGLFWYFAFAIPTFALLAPFLHILQYLRDGHAISRMFPIESWLIPQVFACVIPILITWVALWVLSWVMARNRSTRSNHA